MAVKNCPKCNSKGLGGIIYMGHPNGMNSIRVHVACCSNLNCIYAKPNYQDYDKWQKMERENEQKRN